MVKAKIISIEKGTEYEGVIYDYWLEIELNNKTRIKIFDYKYLEDIESLLNKYVYIELSTIFIDTEPQKELFNLLGEIHYINNIYIFRNDFIEIKLSKEDIITLNLRLNTEIALYFGRIDIEKIVSI
ncbi:hypothetical protein HW278_08225 [Capnocytophaga sp. oral taxon 902]|uniref:Uncharacterized protein n=1 Tax=Capnocytophaga ochracea TaxID=1018 RepID=A0AA46W9H9_CAPOC|nr:MULTISPECIES: hypothetical protein [Capnocytophaga]QLF50686.1 hypothetical protein HW278_08225 [Capnocytophaga sp. oral taxon 902]UZD41886.1 hypothetical protein OL231_04900 [Capnocytophaga ochracea]